MNLPAECIFTIIRALEARLDYVTTDGASEEEESCSEALKIFKNIKIKLEVEE